MARSLLIASTLAGVLLSACGLGSAASTATTSAGGPGSSSPAALTGCPGRPHATASPPASVVASPVPPRGGAPVAFPFGGGFDTFAVVDPGVLSRSGTPTSTQFELLRAEGWKGIADVRTTDDRAYTGFDKYGFKYLQIGVDAGGIPTDAEAAQFLCFVTDKANQPVDAHDNSGLERVGLFIALYRYSVQGWAMVDAVHEETLFGDALNDIEVAYLYGWAAHVPPGTFRP